MQLKQNLPGKPVRFPVLVHEWQNRLWSDGILKQFSPLKRQLEMMSVGRKPSEKPVSLWSELASSPLKNFAQLVLRTAAK